VRSCGRKRVVRFIPCTGPENNEIIWRKTNSALVWKKEGSEVYTLHRAWKYLNFSTGPANIKIYGGGQTVRSCGRKRGGGSPPSTGRSRKFIPVHQTRR